MVCRQAAVRKLQITDDKQAQSTYRNSHSRTHSPQTGQISVVKWHQECKQQTQR